MYDKKLFFIVSVILSLICVHGLIVKFLGFSLFLKIIITELSVFLVLVCLLGCSVLHVQRWRDSGSDYSLLNNLYTVLAVILQVQSIVLLGQNAVDVFCLDNPLIKSSAQILLGFFRRFNMLNTLSLTFLTVYRQYKAYDYLNLSVDPKTKWIIITLEFLLSLFWTGITFIWPWFFCHDYECVCEEETGCGLITITRTSLSVILIVCVLLLLKVAEDSYGILNRTKKKALSSFRSLMCINQNTVTPFNDENDVQEHQGQVRSSSYQCHVRGHCFRMIQDL